MKTSAQLLQRRLVRASAIVLAYCLASFGGPASGQTPAGRDWSHELQMKIDGPFTIASVGDLLISQPVGRRKDPALQATLDLLRRADVAYGNFETNIHDEDHYTGPLGFMNGPASIAEDIKAMGIDIVGRANNHAMDGDLAGFFETNDLLLKAGLVVTGAGRTLDEARRPRYFDGAHGRIGAVAVHTPHFNIDRLRAARTEGDAIGRPGINGLFWTRTIIVSEGQMAALKKVRDELYGRHSDFSYPTPQSKEAADEINFFGQRYKVGPNPGDNTYVANAQNNSEILDQIRSGKEYAHFMIVGIHSHQGVSQIEQDMYNEAPPDELIRFAHASIDSGADIFFGTGPHVLRGIEIYKGKPIFYGQGEFFSNLYATVIAPSQRAGLTNAEAAVRNWDSAYGYGLMTPVNMQSFVAVTKYDKGKLQEVRIYPTEGRAGGPVVDAGTPRLADPRVAKTILERLQRLSAPFGTKISIEGSVGVIRGG